MEEEFNRRAWQASGSRRSGTFAACSKRNFRHTKSDCHGKPQSITLRKIHVEEISRSIRFPKT
jgi:hypothetical protein